MRLTECFSEKTSLKACRLNAIMRYHTELRTRINLASRATYDMPKFPFSAAHLRLHKDSSSAQGAIENALGIWMLMNLVMCRDDYVCFTESFPFPPERSWWLETTAYSWISF